MITAVADWRIAPWRCWLPPAHAMMMSASNLSAVPRSRVDNNGALAPLVAPCLCNDGDDNSTQEGSGNGALTPLIAPCWCNYDGGGGGGSADDSASAFLVTPCLCGNDSGCGVQEGSNDGALALSVVTYLCNDNNGSGA